MNIVDNVIDRLWTNRLRKTKKRRREKKKGKRRLEFLFFLCYNRSGNAEARSIYGHFRALFKHCVSDVIIEAEMWKHEVFISISAPYSNIA